MRRKPPSDGPRQPNPPALGVVALVGRPNVGKSSLFNRMVGGRPAIVEDEPGITRDRRYGEALWTGRTVRIIDTGGLDPSAEGILGAMRTQTLRAVDEADALILVIDAREGATGLDKDVAQVLRRTGKPVFIAANKVDSGNFEAQSADAHQLGFPEVFAVSAEHGRGVGVLLDRVIEVLTELKPPTPAAMGVEAGIRIALVGKPNVGKSSLINRMLGDQRVLVHDQPGTTRDPIDTPFEWEGQRFVLVDTAGMRKRRQVTTLTEAVSAKMARDQIARANVVALVIDLETGASDDDARLASLVEEEGRALLIVMNKRDRIPAPELDAKKKKALERLNFVGHAPFLLTSARTGAGVEMLPKKAAEVYEQWTRRVPTAELNRLLEKIVHDRPPPTGPNGRQVRLYYMTQAESSPPSFFISSNQPAALTYPYRRYLVNQIRKAYGFDGSPLRVFVRGRGKHEDEA
ncbi:MAG: ribosome biogenesis GTPase Der [Deltaproteobacteria bacterium]|nr:ribosome biogenesis GTPase Der [Deltaproteobacteria bacterium]